MSYNGEMFRLARQYRGLTQKELAAALKVEPSTLSRLENKLLEPADALAIRAAELLRVPLEFLKQPERIYGLPVSVHPMWRKKKAVSQHLLDCAFAELNIRLIHLRRLTRSAEFEPVLEMPSIDIETAEGGAEAIAADVRRAWMVPAGPIDDLTAWVERAGCFVIHVDLPDVAMAGVTLRISDLPPCIFINRSMPADRMRFTLAHELGHLVMHRLPTASMEDEANAFASALLMPAADIAHYFRSRKIDLRLLAALKPEWRVAMSSLLYRAQTLGYVSDNQARYLWQQFSMKKIRMREPPELDFPPEEPVLLKKLIALHMDDLGYTLQDLAAVAVMHEEEVSRLYGLGSPERKSHLRLVS